MEPAAEEMKDYMQVIASLKGIGLVKGKARHAFKDSMGIETCSRRYERVTQTPIQVMVAAIVAVVFEVYVLSTTS